MALNVNKGRQPKPRRIMLYGVPGVGKSTFAAQAPDAIFMPLEDGVGDLDVDRLEVPKSLDTVIEQIASLIREDHTYKWLVIDTADWLERLLHKHICATQNVESIDKASGGFGKGYVLAVKLLDDVVRGLDVLRQQRGVGIIFLAHSKTEKHNDPTGADYDRYEPAMRWDATELLIQWCDEVLFANHKTYTKEVDAGWGKKSNKAIGTGERIMITQGGEPAAISKNRLNLPPEMPLDWHEFSKFLPQQEKKNG